MQTRSDLMKITQILQPKLNETLSHLTRQAVTVSLQNCDMIPITEVHTWLDSSQSAQSSIYIPIMGDVTGDIFLFLPSQSAFALVDLMIGNPIGTTTLLGEFEASALKELGNITTGVIVTEIANLLKISMMLTIPNLATDMVGALVDQVLIEYGETSEHLLAIQFPFKFLVQNAEIEGSFVLFFDKPSSDVITQKLSQLEVKEQSNE